MMKHTHTHNEWADNCADQKQKKELIFVTTESGCGHLFRYFVKYVTELFSCIYLNVKES